jgi:hypothetical protein
MSFSSLTNELDGFFDKDLANLPAKQSVRVERDFSPWKWGGMSPDERRNIAKAWDFQNDPATAADWQRVQKHCDDLATAEAERDYWQSRGDDSASDAAIKQDRLTPILKRLDELGAEHKVMRGDEIPTAPNSTSAAPTNSPAGKETTEQRRARWLGWYEGEVSSSGEHGALERVTAREKLLHPKADRSYIGKQLKVAREERAKQNRAGCWTSQLGARR